MENNMPDELTILIIRHAEKPGEIWPGPGLTADGKADSKSLVVRGWQRAGAWATLLGTECGGQLYPKPGRIYAAQPGDGTPNEGPSNRPYETVTALAARLNLDIDKTCKQGEEAKLVGRVLGETGVVL